MAARIAGLEAHARACRLGVPVPVEARGAATVDADLHPRVDFVAPKNRGPDQCAPVMARAMVESERYRCAPGHSWARGRATLCLAAKSVQASINA